MSGIVIVLERSSFPDLENRQLASREHKVGIKRNITRHERNKDLPSFIYMNLSEIVGKENWGRFASQIINLKYTLCFSDSYLNFMMNVYNQKYLFWLNDRMYRPLTFLSFDVDRVT